MKNLTFTIAAIFGLMLFNCDFNDPVDPFAIDTKTPLFFLLFAVNENQMVDVEFSTNSMSVIPAVTVGEDTLKASIDFHEGIIRGELHNLKFTKTYEYSIAVNNKRTKGEIVMPTAPKNVKCNDTLLVEQQLNFLNKADSVRFEWSCDSFDHFCCNLEANSNIEATINDTILAYPADGSYHYKLNLASVKGPSLKPGTRPNVEGDCGDGFVMGLSRELEYNVWFDGAGLMKSEGADTCFKDMIRSKLLRFMKREM